MGEYLLQAGTTMVLDFFFFSIFFIFSLAVQGRFVFNPVKKLTVKSYWPNSLGSGKQM